ncbi:MAG: Rid family hydrolase [Actinomycetes bacterium]
MGFGRAVRVELPGGGAIVHVAGTGPVWPEGACVDDARAQADRCFEIALGALAEAGGTPADVVRTRMYLTDPAAEEAVGAAHLAHVGAAAPAATMVVVAALADPRWVVEIELEAVLDGEERLEG